MLEKCPCKRFQCVIAMTVFSYVFGKIYIVKTFVFWHCDVDVLEHQWDFEDFIQKNTLNIDM